MRPRDFCLGWFPTSGWRIVHSSDSPRLESPNLQFRWHGLRSASSQPAHASSEKRQVFQGKGYGVEVDLWSLGVMLFEFARKPRDLQTLDLGVPFEKGTFPKHPATSYTEVYWFAFQSGSSLGNGKTPRRLTHDPNQKLGSSPDEKSSQKSTELSPSFPFGNWAEGP